VAAGEHFFKDIIGICFAVITLSMSVRAWKPGGVFTPKSVLPEHTPTFRPPMHLSQVLKPSFLLCLLLTFSTASHPHGRDWISPHALDWTAPNITEVFSAAPYTPNKDHPKVSKVKDKHCITGPFLNIDVDDHYAFDIDETLTLEIEFDRHQTPDEVQVSYDKNGGLATPLIITLPKNSQQRFYRHRLTLERARFAGRTIRFINLRDIAISSAKAPLTEAVSMCDIVLSRQAPKDRQQQKAQGQLNLTLQDAKGQPLPARIGIYDHSGRMVLPNQQAIALRFNADFSARTLLMPANTAWPADNRLGFYINGHYQSSLPVGEYRIIIARGPEYPVLAQRFTIEAEQLLSLNKTLRPWLDMAAKGWYAGDTHIHYQRADREEHQDLQTIMQAEHLSVANLLQMDDIGTVGFKQYNWGADAYHNDALFALVPGQEGPRSNRGHTMHLNIKSPSHHPERYYYYHEKFAATRRQGGVTGYAHVRKQHGFGAAMGLALDVPFELVDVVEVLQFGQIDLSIWFDFLNLGYRLTPVAGTDFTPLAAGNLPGNERNYVHVGKDYSVQAWFDGLKAGRTFATNGPMLEFSANNQNMGGTVVIGKGGSVEINAKALLNPDIGMLNKLTLYQQGEVIATATPVQDSQQIKLTHNFDAEQGGWVVVKAEGLLKTTNTESPQKLFAVSAPIYISVDGSGTCKVEQVPALVATLRQHIEDGFASSMASQYSFPHAVRISEKQWARQSKVLQATRVTAVEKHYENLLLLAGAGECLYGLKSTI